MQSSESRTFAQFGGLLLLVSLVLPYYALSFAGIGAESFRVWRMDKGAFVLVAAYGLLAIAQIRLSSRETMALIYLIIGSLFTAALIYKFWISPPGSAPIGDLGGAATSQTYNGKPIASISPAEILKAMGIELKPSYGAYVATLGSIFFTVGALLEFRNSGGAATPALEQAAAPAQQTASPAQRYQAPVQPQQQYVAPDPFAVPAQQPAAPAAPPVPPDPFAVRPKPPTP